MGHMYDEYEANTASIDNTPESPPEDKQNESNNEMMEEEVESHTETEQSDAEEPFEISKLIARVRRTNYEGFINYNNSEEASYILNALYGGPSLKQDIARERERRKNIKKNRVPNKASGSARKEANHSSAGGFLHRLRILSPFIVEYLTGAAGKTCPEPREQYTFFRPFKLLIQLQPKMKEELAGLESQWGHSAPADYMEDPEHQEEKPERSVDVDGKYALAHMRVYVDFVEREIMPLYTQFDGTENRKILFTDLWYLYREGDLVYSPVPSGKRANSSIMAESFQTCHKVYSFVSPLVPDDPDATKYHSILPEGRYSDEDLYPSDDDLHEAAGSARVWCYYIDFDGGSYGPVPFSFKVLRYEGERDITSLPVYPTRFLSNEAEFLDTQRKMGRLFMDRVGQKHLYHTGWTMTHEPTGSGIDSDRRYPEYIDSEVIVDFNEAFQSSPSWRPTIRIPQLAETGTWGWGLCAQDDATHLKRWALDHVEQTRHCLHFISYEDVGLLRRNNAIKNDPFLMELAKSDEAKPAGDSVLLLPKRLVVYALRERRFVHVNVSRLMPIKRQANVFDSLKINEGHQRIIRSLVQDHFRQKRDRPGEAGDLNQDFIRGKGTGLFFLLHGVPGVGKTATAEAIAQENERPLFAITCADLGFEPAAVEKNLSRIFRLASRWGCVLLLDEADIFFTKRTPTDLQRNGLVSAFLRILEYYSGILFLTTNRVGIIDEAFKSRIHLSLYYPPLDEDQTKQIFEVNINRLEQIEEHRKKHHGRRLQVNRESILRWSEKHYQTAKEDIGRWNGRQIRNAFQIAASLANFDLYGNSKDTGSDNEKDDGSSDKLVTLDSHHFEIVANATHEFDQYMVKARKGTDAKLASLE